jgi:hypothetical protein
MSFEKAVDALREIHFGAIQLKQHSLGAKALRLLAEIVENQVDPQPRQKGTAK